jgi:molybdopterin/thiamine biosynthesis adenylyltransferase
MFKQYWEITNKLKHTHSPLLFRMDSLSDKTELAKIISSNHGIRVYDEIHSQLIELVKLRQPNKRLSLNEINFNISHHTDGKEMEDFGVWAFYPWNNSLIHILDEKDFIEVRTNRNKHKITQKEQQVLTQKSIGIIGLSVGHSIATTLALERVCGEIRLADFDTLELSNLNRINSRLENIGVNKTIIAARAISEIDPYIKVVIEQNGISESNLSSFLLSPKRIDLLIEVCDGLDIKVLCREFAKKHQIPVVMDTNDKGMLDIERFDLEPNRPIFHGLAGNLTPETLKGLTNEQKIPYILEIVGADKISTRLKASMLEVEQSINTWPQLGSSVVLGGAITTDVSRRILLNQLQKSGRFYVDIEEIINDSDSTFNSQKNESQTLATSMVAFENLAINYLKDFSPAFSIPETDKLSIIQAAINAPSAGNNQPWIWFHQNGHFMLMHHRIRSESWGDYFEMGAFMSLGCAIESFQLKAFELGYACNINLIDDVLNPELIAHITLNLDPSNIKSQDLLELAKHLEIRTTNRKTNSNEPLSIEAKDALNEIFRNDTDLKYYYMENKESLDQMAKIIASCDRIRLLNPKGHQEFFSEIRWSKQEARESGDGIDIDSADLTEAEKAGFYLAKDPKAIDLINDWNLGSGFKKMSMNSINSASGIGLITTKEFNKISIILAGKAILRFWIKACMNNIAIYPMLSPAFFFNRANHGNGFDIPEKFKTELLNLDNDFKKIFQLNPDEYPLFIFKASIATTKPNKSFRLKMDSVFINHA